MMKRESALRILRHELPRLRALYGVRSLRLVGSMARGDAGTKSDVDLLVDFEELPSLVTLGRIKADLEQRMNTHVDVMMESGLRPRTRKRMLSEAVQV